MTRAIALVAVLTVTGLGLAPATPAAEVRLPFPPAAGPQPAGAAIAWAQRDGDTLTVRRSGGAPSVVVAGGAAGEQREVVGLAASEEATAVAVGRSTPRDGGAMGDQPIAVDVLAGPALGPLTVMRTCLGNADVAVEGTRAALPGEGCDGVEVRDVAGGPSRPVTPRGRLVGMAGRFVAWTEPVETGGSAVVVYDLDAATVAYRTPAFTPAGVASLGSDGTVALVAQVLHPRETRPRFRAFWASPEEPRLHPLALPAAGVSSLRVAPGRVAYLATGSSGSTTLAVEELRGGATRVLSRRVALVPSGVGFDGATVTYPRLDCRGVTLVRRRADRGVADGVRRGCPLRVDGPVLVGGRTLRLRLSCVGFDPDCTGRVTVRARRGSAVLARGASAPGGQAPLRLTRAGRRYVRHVRRPRLRVEAVLGSFRVNAAERRVAVVRAR